MPRGAPIRVIFGIFFGSRWIAGRWPIRPMECPGRADFARASVNQGICPTEVGPAPADEAAREHHPAIHLEPFFLSMTR